MNYAKYLRTHFFYRTPPMAASCYLIEVLFNAFLYNLKFLNKESVAQTCSVRNVFLEISQNSQGNTCAGVYFLIKLQAACNFIKKETLAQVFSYEFCEISKNIFFTEHLW